MAILLHRRHRQLSVGTPRLTNDLDLTLLTGFGAELTYAEALLEMFESRIADPLTFAQANRVVLVRTPDGVPVDIALGAMPFEERTIEGATLGEYADRVALRTCSAEDLIVHKVFASRPQDWVDVEVVIVRQRGRLHWSQIREELAVLAELKGEPQLLELLEEVARRAELVLGPFRR
jgi:Nucleotidyltransferase of unknown function (DUF6036)